MSVRVTWLGHATFLIGTPEGKSILIDPWLAGNPKCPARFHEVQSDAILITHGHGDHTDGVMTAARNCSGRIAAIYELTDWLATRGIDKAKLIGMNKGGTLTLDEVSLTVTMTDARHSSSVVKDGLPLYVGEPAGLVLRFSDGLRLYISGDTCLFGDMALIRELEQPDAAILPIGDVYTMNPRAAAHACKLLGVKRVIPGQYGTFPALSGTPAALRDALLALGVSTEMIELEPGSSTNLE